MAMIGIIVSGNAVPTAASTDPTAPSASSSFRPNHSMPFVNSSAPSRITMNARTRIRASNSGPRPGGRGYAQADDDEDEHRNDRHSAVRATEIPHERRGDA